VRVVARVEGDRAVVSVDPTPISSVGSLLCSAGCFLSLPPVVRTLPSP